MIGTGEFERGGMGAGKFAPAGQAVLGLHGAGLREAHQRLRVGFEGVVVVGDHEGVGAQARVVELRLLVREPLLDDLDYAVLLKDP